MKASKQIERDIYRIVSNSSLKDIVNGHFYRVGMRPQKSVSEDVVVAFLTGLHGQEQAGIVLIQVFVPDILSPISGEIVEDIARIGLLESAFMEFIESLENEDYLFYLDSTPQSYPAENGIGQHFINIRLKYRIINF